MEQGAFVVCSYRWALLQMEVCLQVESWVDEKVAWAPSSAECPSFLEDTEKRVMIGASSYFTNFQVIMIFLILTHRITVRWINAHERPWIIYSHTFLVSLAIAFSRPFARRFITFFPAISMDVVIFSNYLIFSFKWCFEYYRCPWRSLEEERRLDDSLSWDLSFLSS